MLANEERFVRVSVAGMNTQLENTLRFFFQGPCKGRYELAADESAEVSIIDVDVYQGKDYLDRCRQRHPDRPLILLSFNDIGDDVDTTLRKPLKPDALLSALNKAMDTPSRTTLPNRAVLQKETTYSVASQATQNQTATSRPATAASPVQDKPRNIAEAVAKQSAAPIAEEPTIEEPAAKKLCYSDEQALLTHLESRSDKRVDRRPQYDTADYLQGHLLQAADKARRLHRSIKLELTGGNIVVMPPAIKETGDTPATLEGLQRVMLNITREVFTSIAKDPLDQRAIKLSKIKNDCPHEGGAGILTKDIDTVMWESAIWASSGRLPVGTSLTDPVQLDRWPNMTRLMLIPGSIRIAALWLEHPLSLQATSRMLGIPESHVFTFFSSLSAVGLARISKRVSQGHGDAHGNGKAVVSARPKSGILGRILNRLRRK